MGYMCVYSVYSKTKYFFILMGIGSNCRKCYAHNELQRFRFGLLIGYVQSGGVTCVIIGLVLSGDWVSSLDLCVVQQVIRINKAIMAITTRSSINYHLAGCVAKQLCNTVSVVRGQSPMPASQMTVISNAYNSRKITYSNRKRRTV